MEHPAFKGRGLLLFPWDDPERYPQRMRLAEIPALMPWHTFVQVTEIVAGINRLIQDVEAGKEVIYDFYSDGEKVRDPEKSRTALFFLRGQPGAPWVLIAPGGGFAYVATLHEGLPVGVELNRWGYNVFVLKYRPKGELVATEDLVSAVRFVQAHARELSVDTRCYGLWGFSAGARMVLRAAYDGRLNPLPSPPAMTVVAYTAGSVSDFTPKAPPAFLLVGTQDQIAPVSRMAALAERMKASGIRVRLHVVQGAPHGFGKGTGSPALGWIEQAVSFFKEAAQCN
jgi:acetyl esterase/lipase